MNSRYFSVVTASLLFGGLLVHAEDGGRPARGPIVYDSHWQVHHVDPGVRVHSGYADDRSSLRTSTLLVPGALRDEIRLPQSGTPTYIRPPQRTRPDQEEGRRNWIVPTLDDEFSSYGPGGAEDEEPSGWGWLADDIGRRRRARDTEWDKEDAMREDAEREWLIQRDPARPGLFMGDSFAPAPLRPVAEDTDEREERDRGRIRRGATRADFASNERPDMADTRTSSDSTEPFEIKDPYAIDPLSAASWELDMTQRQNKLTASSLNSSLPEAWHRDTLMAPLFSAWRESSVHVAAQSVRTPDSSSMRTMPQGFDAPRAGVTDSFGMLFGGGTDRAGFGSTGFAPTSDFGSRWGADWSGDSGWQQGGIAEPARPSASGLSPHAPSSPGIFYNNGWLADPVR